MKINERRKAIVALLMSGQRPISGKSLAEYCHVSRQIIVQDLAVLRGQGYEILSTHHGYILQKSPLAERVVKVKHTSEQTEEELTRIVRMGGTVVDVFVWHKVYGKISVPLNIFSMLHVRQFMEGVRTGKSTELMTVTGGYHYHTIRADSEEMLDRITDELDRQGYIVPEL